MISIYTFRTTVFCTDSYSTCTVSSVLRANRTPKAKRGWQTHPLLILYTLLVSHLLPNHSRCRGLLLHLITLNDTYTLGRIPLNDRSAPRRHLYLLKTQHSQQTNIHIRGGNRTRNPSKRVAADVRLRPRGHWDRLLYTYESQNVSSYADSTSVKFCS